MASGFAHAVTPELRQLLARVLPGATLLEVEPLASDGGADERTAKAAGYGEPLRLRIRDAEGREQRLVFHTAHPDVFGHDRRADRAAELLLCYDRFSWIPRHVRALDVGAVDRDGKRLISLADAGEFYLVTSYADGHPYADELRRLAHEKRLLERDLDHCDRLAKNLADIHSEKHHDDARYVRALRDVIGSGEGLFGLIDAYPPDVEGAPLARLRRIEARAVEWRHMNASRSARLSRIHGDYHPFNVLFDDMGGVHLLDASRGCLGDPADDVICMAINYVFFGVEEPTAWGAGLRDLYYRFFQSYLAETGDTDVFAVIAPYLAWRALVVCCPVWYPHVGGPERDRVFRFVERALDAPRFEPEMAEEVFV